MRVPAADGGFSCCLRRNLLADCGLGNSWGEGRAVVRAGRAGETRRTWRGGAL